MQLILSITIAVLAILMVVSEIYKVFVESKPELKDERGIMIQLKVKNVSYYILIGGIILGVILVKNLEFLAAQHYISFIMIVFFVQSIASAIVLNRLKRI